MVIAFLLLIIGNVFCYYYNNRPLYPLTNVVAVVLILVNFVNNGSKSI